VPRSRGRMCRKPEGGGFTSWCGGEIRHGWDFKQKVQQPPLKTKTRYSPRVAELLKPYGVTDEAFQPPSKDPQKANKGQAGITQGVLPDVKKVEKKKRGGHFFTSAEPNWPLGKVTRSKFKQTGKPCV